MNCYCIASFSFCVKGTLRAQYKKFSADLLENNVYLKIVVNDNLPKGIQQISQNCYEISSTFVEDNIRKIIGSVIIDEKMGFFLHSSLLTRDEKSFLFLGDGGSGKSTILNKMCHLFVPGNDDINIVGKDGVAYSTPFVNPYKVKDFSKIILENTCGKIDKIFWLRKEFKDRSFVSPITDDDLLWRFLTTQIGFPFFNKKSLPQLLNDMLPQFIEQNRFYYLYHNLNDSAEFLEEVILDR